MEIVVQKDYEIGDIVALTDYEDRKATVTNKLYKKKFWIDKTVTFVHYYVTHEFICGQENFIEEVDFGDIAGKIIEENA